MNHNQYEDDSIRRGFINQDSILACVTQEEVFELVFGYQPKEYVYVTSPFRIDKNPGCWFERTTSYTGKLRFVDYGGQFGKPIDCFDAVKHYFQLPNFYLTLEFVYERLIKGKIEVKGVFLSQKQERRYATIQFDSRPFVLQDGRFWSKYGISRQNLIEDKQFAVKKFYITDGKRGDYSSKVYDIAYADTNYEEGRKKLYFPNRKGKGRFITTCRRDDIGGLHKLPPFGQQLIIKKSYKDWRVVINQGKYAIYLQNEGMIPLEYILMNIVKNFSQVIVWFDNDTQGILSSQKIATLINNHFPNKATPLWLPEYLNPIGISDPSDLYHKQGQTALQQFLKQYT